MQSDYLPDDLKILWKEMEMNPAVFSPDQLRKEADKLRAGLRRRSIIGGGAAWIVIAGFMAFFFVFPNALERIGSALTVLGAAYMVVQLRMRPPRVLPDLSETGCTQFYRAELERQRDFHRGSWFWSRLLILLPGPIVFLVGFAQAYPEAAPFMWLDFATLLVLAILAVPLNLRLARKYQRRIDMLDASRQGS
jgi:hypothetical protein